VVAVDPEVALPEVKLALELQTVRVRRDDAPGRGLPQLLDVAQEHERVAHLQVVAERRVIRPLAATKFVRPVALAPVLVGEYDISPGRHVEVERFGAVQGMIEGMAHVRGVAHRPVFNLQRLPPWSEFPILRPCSD